MKKRMGRRWLAAVLAVVAAAWFAGGREAVAQDSPGDDDFIPAEGWRDYAFVLKSARIADAEPSPAVPTAGTSGRLAEFTVRWWIPQEVPYYGAEWLQIEETDRVYFRVGLQCDGLAGEGEGEVTWLSPEECVYQIDPQQDGGSTPATVRGETIDAAMPWGSSLNFPDGNYNWMTVGDLRQGNRTHDSDLVWVAWQSHEVYPSTNAWPKAWQCLAQGKCRFVLQWHLVASTVTELPAELISADLYTDWLELGTGKDIWTYGDDKASLTVEREGMDRFALEYTTPGNRMEDHGLLDSAESLAAWAEDVQETVHPDCGWTVTFVSVDSEGNRRIIDPDEISFEDGQASLDRVQRAYYPFALEKNKKEGYNVAISNEWTWLYREPSFWLSDGSATVRMHWNPIRRATGRVEAWVRPFFGALAKNWPVAEFSDRIFGVRKEDGIPVHADDVTWIDGSEVEDGGYYYSGAYYREAYQATRRWLSCLPRAFGQYRESRGFLPSLVGHWIKVCGSLRDGAPVVALCGDDTVNLEFDPAIFGGTGAGKGYELYADGKWQGFVGTKDAPETIIWHPDERGMHLLEVDGGDGIVGMQPLWYDKVEWAELPYRSDPGVEAVSLYPWSTDIALDVALEAADPSRPAAVFGYWADMTGIEHETDIFDKMKAMESLDAWGEAERTGPSARREVIPERPITTLRWDAAADVGPGARKQETAIIMGAEWSEDAREGADTYLVVDLSDGPDAESWPVSLRCQPPEGGWGGEYKTDKLVLRRVDPGAFTMGSPADEPSRSQDEARHPVRLTQSFYVGVFEVTQGQWERVMGTDAPSRSKTYDDDTLPVAQVDYFAIRGDTGSDVWPEPTAVTAGSFMGRLREKARGFAWDLPTEAQWEYACRAGTDTAFNDGSSMNNPATHVVDTLSLLGRYGGNREDGTGGEQYNRMATLVGGYLPNAWGLYDMHGNVKEWTRTGWTTDFGTVQNEAGEWVDPPGGSFDRFWASGCTRGGDFNVSAAECRSAARYEMPPSNQDDYTGFRVGAFIWPLGGTGDDNGND